MAIHKTRLYALEKDRTQFEPLGDIDGFIPNIHDNSIIGINGRGSYRVSGIRTDIDLQDDFVIQSILMKAE